MKIEIKKIQKSLIEKRLTELNDSIKRYIDLGIKPPDELLELHNDLCTWLRDYRDNK